MITSYENIIAMGKSGAGKQPRIDVLTRTFGLKQLSTGDMFRTYLGLYDELGYAGDLSGFYNTASEDFIPDTDIKKALGVAEQANADDIVMGMKAKYYVNQGRFVPDTITNALFEASFKAMGCRGAVLDGYPRTLAQARFLLELAKREDARIDAILLVENDDDAIKTRTTGRRICKTCKEVYHIDYRPPPETGSCKMGPAKCEIIQRSDDTLDAIESRLQEYHTKTKPALDFLTEMNIPLYKVPGNLPTYSPEAVEASVFDALGLT